MLLKQISPPLLVIFSGIIAALHIGKMPVAIPVLREALNISIVDAGFLLATIQFAGMATGALMGVAIDSAGLRRSLILGQVILAIAGIGGAFADTPNTLLAFRALEGFGFLLSVLAAPALIRHLVPPERMAQYLSFWGVYMPTGAAIALLIGPSVMQFVGWRGMWIFLASLSVMMAVWVMVVVQTDAVLKKAGGHSALPKISDSWLGRLWLTLKNKNVWCVALAFAMYSSQWLAVIGFLPSIYEQAGFSKASTGALTAFVCGVNVIGNISAGKLLQRRYSPGHLLYVGFAVMAFTAFTAFHPITNDFPLIRYMSVVMFSAIGGLVPGSLFALVVRAAPNDRTVSTSVGWMQQCSSSGQFFAPSAIALLASVAGGWHYTWIVTGAASVLGLLFVSMMSPKVRSGSRTVS